jgi:ZIP family zinc transporter
MIALMISGIIALFVTPGPRLTSAIQHFAAGVVFVAVAVELLPELIQTHAAIAISIGFAIGTVVVLSVRSVFAATEGVTKTQQPIRLLLPVGIDLLIDGFLLGIGFAAGEKQGILLALALMLEVFFVGLSTVTTLRQNGMAKPALLVSVGGLALVIALGALLGTILTSVLSGVALGGVLAFGAAALLYLVTEELLVEAHEVPDTPLTTAPFFIGFLLFLIITMVS